MREHWMVILIGIAMLSATPFMLLLRLAFHVPIHWVVIAVPWVVIAMFAAWIVYLLSHVGPGG